MDESSEQTFKNHFFVFSGVWVLQLLINQLNEAECIGLFHTFTSRLICSLLTSSPLIRCSWEPWSTPQNRLVITEEQKWKHKTPQLFDLCAVLQADQKSGFLWHTLRGLFSDIFVTASTLEHRPVFCLVGVHCSLSAAFLTPMFYSASQPRCWLESSFCLKE